MIEQYKFATKNRHVDIPCEITYPKKNVSFYYMLNLYAVGS